VQLATRVRSDLARVIAKTSPGLMSFRCPNSFSDDALENSSCQKDAANPTGGNGTVEHDNTSTLSAVHVCKRLFRWHHTIARQNKGQTGSTIAHKHTLRKMRLASFCCVLAECCSTNSNVNTEGLTRSDPLAVRCRDCTRVVHSHVPTRIFLAALQLHRCDSGNFSSTTPHFGQLLHASLFVPSQPTPSITLSSRSYTYTSAT